MQLKMLWYGFESSPAGYMDKGSLHWIGRPSTGMYSGVNTGSVILHKKFLKQNKQTNKQTKYFAVNKILSFKFTLLLNVCDLSVYQYRDM